MKTDKIVLLPIQQAVEFIHGHLASRCKIVEAGKDRKGLELLEDDIFFQMLTAQMVGYLEAKFITRHSFAAGEVAGLAMNEAEKYQYVMESIYAHFFKGKTPALAARKIARASYHQGFMDAVSLLQNTFSQNL